MTIEWSTGGIKVNVNGLAEDFWSYEMADGGGRLTFHAPVLEIDGRSTRVELEQMALVGESVELRNGTRETVVEGTLRSDSYIRMKLVFRIAPDNPVVRFRYRWSSRSDRRLTKASGCDTLSYGRINLNSGLTAKEVRLSDYNELAHSYVPTEVKAGASAFLSEQLLMGPILAWGTEEGISALLAYEHGSQYPDIYTGFRLHKDGSAEVTAVKGNYYRGQTLRKRVRHAMDADGCCPWRGREAGRNLPYFYIAALQLECGIA
ncbi:hypothetical protein [Paenibacillus roseipurpureus]|uniref:Uncharacterized protein n=1 Tax=Paenibacillus roseopurpureus TaxID=2918901 RepID=A0AA96RJB5_9BACL|nr:hypothetical protein [Paenibacillus sp. MBLB1832]WNR42981.1 hypothetical protein MJB10_17895 [Paenibacillus sp. MBLB1832]